MVGVSRMVSTPLRSLRGWWWWWGGELCAIRTTRAHAREPGTPSGHLDNASSASPASPVDSIPSLCPYRRQMRTPPRPKDSEMPPIRDPNDFPHDIPTPPAFLLSTVELILAFSALLAGLYLVHRMLEFTP